ncbi:hypothetical protein O6H91_02G004000 [Diphasiastrum complanatum]|uniref:Uncharacterized protein n=1 Tax=Diphasiastrum complanatum TaxID=34168 RepID=A0ACC2ECC0_DIPCM|nr:hypothetical protein O6H91_02G004000 [Diphasiastrum complanatum]
MGRSEHPHGPPLDSPTFVRVPLPVFDCIHPVSWCGEIRKPSVDFLTNKWNVFLDNHIPQPVFDAMMREIYDGPKFRRFLCAYYCPGNSCCGLLFNGIFMVPYLIVRQRQMQVEVDGKLSAWNKVLSTHNCGVTMQINKLGLIFNISPTEIIKAKAHDEVQHQLFLELGLKHN